MTTPERLRRVVGFRTARERTAMLGQIRARRAALADTQAQAQQQDAELDRAIALLGDLPYAQALLRQAQALLGRELDAVYGGIQTLDRLFEEIDPCPSTRSGDTAESPAD